VFESSKPIWQGEIRNCSIISGTNTLTSLVSHVNGTVVSPVDSKVGESLFCVTLQNRFDLADVKHKQ